GVGVVLCQGAVGPPGAARQREAALGGGVRGARPLTGGDVRDAHPPRVDVTHDTPSRHRRRLTWHHEAVDRQVVNKAPLFSALDDAAAERLMDSMTPRRLSRGDIVFREGDPGDSLYVIVTG